MPYVGNSPAANFASVTKDLFSGDGSTTAFTLSKAATTNGVAVFVENVRQEPTIAYAVSGTTLTFTAAPVTSSGNNIYVLHHNAPASTANHPAGQDLTAVAGNFTGGVNLTGTTPTLTIGDAGAEDAKIVFDGNAQDYHIGLDDSADSLIIGKGSALGTTSHIVTDANGRVTKPLQPRLNAIRGSSRLDAADGSGTETIVPFVEQTDIGNNFASNTFTCPIDGSYFVSFFGMFINPDAYAFVTIRLNTTTVIAAYEDDNGPKTGSSNVACSAIIVASANDTIKAFFGGGNTSSKLHEGAYGGINIQLIA